MKLGEIEISDHTALQLNLVEDLSETDVRLGDYIRLKGLQVGMMLYLKDDGGGRKIILIGNGTPCEGLTNVSHDGWYWKTYNNWIVSRVLYLQPQLCGSYLDPRCVEDVEEASRNVSQSS